MTSTTMPWRSATASRCYRLMDTKGAMRADGAPYAEAAARAQAIVEGAEFTEAEVDAINLVPDEFRGLDRFEARKRVVAAITAEGLAVTVLKKSGDKETGVGTPGTGALRRGQADHAALRRPLEGRHRADADRPVVRRHREDRAARASTRCATGDTVILPERDEKIYFHWLENIEPWCISRQLWWGHQIPVWYGLTARRAGLHRRRGRRGAGRGGAVPPASGPDRRRAAPPLRGGLCDGRGALPRRPRRPAPSAERALRIVEVADRAGGG